MYTCMIVICLVLVRWKCEILCVLCNYASLAASLRIHFGFALLQNYSEWFPLYSTEKWYPKCICCQSDIMCNTVLAFSVQKNLFITNILLWKMLDEVEKCWMKLKNVGCSWKMLDKVEKCWMKLKNVGRNWKINTFSLSPTREILYIPTISWASFDHPTERCSFFLSLFFLSPLLPFHFLSLL